MNFIKGLAFLIAACVSASNNISTVTDGVIAYRTGSALGVCETRLWNHDWVNSNETVECPELEVMLKLSESRLERYIDSDS